MPDPDKFRLQISGQHTHLYFLKSANIRAAITNYGARLVALWVPDLHDNPVNVALGYPSLQAYLQPPENYMGAIIGRCANRIAGAAFDLNGRHYQLLPNEGNNLLHSGPEGLHSRVWQVLRHQDQELMLRYVSPDGEGGFPGNLTVTVIYSLASDNALRIQYQAVTDAPTLVNLSNHTYFNLSGEGTATAMDHILQLHAAAFTPVDKTQLPTGEIRPVTNTPFDFRQPKIISRDIAVANQQLDFGAGYDQNFVLNGKGEKLAASLCSPRSSIRLRLFTDLPGLQFYSGNHLGDERKGNGGKAYPRRSAVALEPQFFPDAIHHPNFPSVVLQPAQAFESSSSYVFDCPDALTQSPS